MFKLMLLLLCSWGNMPNENSPEDLKALIERVKQADPDLYSLAQNETSGGVNLDHKPVTKGLNKGHTAGGPWGMMPITAKEIVARNRAIKEQYPEVEASDPDIITQALNTNPQMAYALAKAEYERRLKVLQGDKSKAAYSWLNGVTGTKNAKPEDIIASEYVQKFLGNLPQNKIGQK